MYLPIAAEAEAASRAAAELPPGKRNLPARTESDASLIPNITKTATRWIRPFVPPIVARAIDTTTHPLRTARQAFEEVEEITFAFKRTHKVTVSSEESAEPTEQAEHGVADPRRDTRRIDSSRAVTDRLGSDQGQPELGGLDGPHALRRVHSSRELPPAE